MKENNQAKARKMSALGTKFVAIVTVVLVVVCLIITVLSMTMSLSLSTDLVADHAASGVRVLQYDLNAEAQTLAATVTNWSNTGFLGSCVKSGTFTQMDDYWKDDQFNEYYYGAIYDTTGALLWSSANYKLTAVTLDKALAGETVIHFAADANLPLSLQCLVPIKRSAEITGVMVAGIDMQDNSLLDAVKEKSNCEITLFAGKTRYSTTVMNAGERAVGTDMSAAVESAVIGEGVDYLGEADILGQNHFVNYAPIKDDAGAVIGAYFAGISTADYDSMKLTVFIVCIATVIVSCLIAGLIIFLIIGKMITRPLDEVNKIADELSRGEFSTAGTSYKFAKDEMGEFAQKMTETKHELNSYISDISGVLANMAGGNFGTVNSIEYEGDFSAISDAFSTIRSNLTAIVESMNRAAEDVTAGANQIADGSQVLSAGTITQASAVDELSSAVSDISRQIERSAEGAANADELSKQTAEKISVQDVKITEMISAMQDIKDKSDQISGIIKTIEDIAFQTNILALNAAIEAARAGEAGKGFAVVADEVRNLAAKSADAANSTTALISATIESVDNGSEIAEDTARTMKDVMEISGQTNALIADISEGAAKQEEAVKQITEKIEMITNVVQQNSATAEQSAASSEELSSQAEVLKEQIAQFTV